MRRSIKRSIKSNIKVQITGGNEAVEFAVSNQSISRGALTLTGAAAHTFAASTGTINSIGTVTGASASDWNISYSSNTVTCSPSGDGLANGPYSLTIPCYPEASQGGTPVNVTFSCTTIADTYTVGSESDYAAAITDIGTASSGARTVSMDGDAYDWDNANLNNKGFTNLVTITGGTFNAMRIGVAPAQEVEIRAPQNIRFDDVDFVGSFDASLHTTTTVLLKVKGEVDNFTITDCDLTGNLTTLGPASGSFRGALGGDGTTKLVGDCVIENCRISGCGRGLNLTTNTDVQTGRYIARNNEIFDCATDGIIIGTPSDNHLIEDNYLHNFYNDPWNVQILSNARLSSTGLTGAADGQQFTYYCRHRFEVEGYVETIYQQGSALRIYRDADGNINCDINDTGGTQRIALSSGAIVTTGIADILISVDTAGTSRMWIQRQNTDGSGVWTEEDSQVASSETLDLTATPIAWLSNTAGGENVDGNTVIHEAWHGVAPDISQLSIRNEFATAFNDRVQPSDTATAIGDPIVAFYGFNTDLDNGINNGTGGNFTKPGGNFDNAHGDFIQGIPGAIRNVSGWVFRRNMLVSGRSDNSPFVYNFYQGIFLEDIANPTDQYQYVDCRIYDNCVLTFNTVHGISIFNAVRPVIYNNTIAYDPSTKMVGGLEPAINVQTQFGGTGSGAVVNDNVTPDDVDIGSGLGSESNNIVADDLTVGANAWSNLYDGPDFSVATKAEALAKFSAKAGGPLLLADPDIGAIGTAYTDWVNQTSTARYADTTPPALSSASSVNVGTDGWSGTVDTDEGNGDLSYIATENNSAPSATQIEAGQDGTGAAAADSGTQSVSGAGTQNVSGTGLTDSTPYFVWYFHRDAAGNPSTVVSGGTFTTDAASGALVDDDFTTNTDTYPDWTETYGVKSYNGTDDRLEFTVDNGEAFKGTSLEVTTTASTTYNITVEVGNPNSSSQLDLKIGTTEGAENISNTATQRISAPVSGVNNGTFTGTFTSPGTSTWITVRVRGAAAASNNQLYINSILIEEV